MGQKPNDLMEKKLSKYFTHYIDYKPIISGLDMLETAANIYQVRAEIRKCSENMKCKNMVTAISNTSMTLGYMEYA